MTTNRLTHHTVTREGQSWVVRFPHLTAWFQAAPGTDAESYRGHTIEDLTAALAYAAALVALASVQLRTLRELDDCDDVFCSADDGDPSLYVSTTLSNARADIAAALVESAKLIDGDAGQGADVNAAADLLRRLRDRERQAALTTRIAEIAGSDNDLHAALFRQVPNMYADLDGAEAAVARLEREVRASVVQRAAMMLAREDANLPGRRAHADPDANTHTVNEHTTEGINQ